MRSRKAVGIFIALVLAYLLVRAATVHSAGEAILVCMPYPVAPAFAAKGWQVVTADNHAAIKEMLRNKLAEVAVVEATSCGMFDSESGEMLAKPRPAYLLFWRKGVQL